MRSEKWLKTLYDANYKSLYRLASHLLYASIGHTSDVQDVLQEVFLLAAREKIYQHPKPEAWLVITTKNLCANFVRSSRRQVRKQGRYAQDFLYLQQIFPGRQGRTLQGAGNFCCLN